MTPHPRLRLRSVVAALSGVGLALAYDAVVLLPLWASHVPQPWAAAIQDGGRPLRLASALSSLAALWWGLYGIHGAGRGGPRRRRGEALLLWGAVALVLALLVLPSLLPGS